MKRILGSMVAIILLAGAAVIGGAGVGTAATANTPCVTWAAEGAGTYARVIPSRTNGSTDCYLIKGNTGNGARALQNGLRGCEGYAIAVDGIYGAGTKSAVTQFQRSQGIGVDGQYGNQVRGRIWFASSTSISGYFFCNRW